MNNGKILEIVHSRSVGPLVILQNASWQACSCIKKLTPLNMRSQYNIRLMVSVSYA